MSKPVRVKRKLFHLFLLLILVTSILILTSFLYPGKVKFIDKARLQFQKSAINNIDHFELVNAYSKNAITYQELIPYLNKLNPGTLIFTSHGKNVCALIPGMWKHSAIYVGSKNQAKNYFGENHPIYNYLLPIYTDKNEHLIVDGSFKRGVSVRCISDMANLGIHSTLRSVICFAPILSKQENLAYLNNCFSETGKGYDLNFVMEDATDIYCTELIYNALIPFNIKLEEYTFMWERNIILPRDMVNIILLNDSIKNQFTYNMCLQKNENQIKMLSFSEALNLNEMNLSP